MRILVVDDEPTNRLILQAMLTREGHEILQAENGQQAIDVFTQEEVDIVLMDVMMPIMDGYSAAKEIKAKSGERFVPIIFLTAITDEEALVECIHNGGDDFLTKPYNRIILKAKMDALVRIQELYKTVRKQNHILETYQKNFKREQELAEKIFSNIMNYGERELPFIHMIHQPAETFNGDIVLVGKHPTGKICLLVGDFTGHGLASALGAFPAAQIFSAMCKKGFSIAEIIIEINTRMNSLLPTGMFLAAALAQINPVTGETIIWNGGLPEIFIQDSEGKIIQRIASSHPPLGVIETPRLDMSAEKVSLQQDQKVIMYTDGIIETQSETGDMYGEQRLVDLIEDNDAQPLTNRLQTALTAFRQTAKQSDDLTLLEFIFDQEQFESVLHPQHMDTQKGKHWEFSINLNAAVLKGVDTASMLLQMINDMQGLHIHNEILYLIVAELYTNALDYGVLQLDSDMKKTATGFAQYYEERAKRLSDLTDGWIEICVESDWNNDVGHLRVRIEDSGKGFDYQGRQETNLEDSIAHHGRGLALLKSLGCDVHFEGKGNIVVADYQIQAGF
jgi:serine phosphatase RsbU (regulator of sigma subunit)